MSGRLTFTGLRVQGLTRRQNRLIVTGVALSRTDIRHAAMTMIDVVPMAESSSQAASSAMRETDDLQQIAQGLTMSVSRFRLA